MSQTDQEELRQEILSQLYRVWLSDNDEVDLHEFAEERGLDLRLVGHVASKMLDADLIAWRGQRKRAIGVEGIKIVEARRLVAIDEINRNQSFRRTLLESLSNHEEVSRGTSDFNVTSFVGEQGISESAFWAYVRFLKAEGLVEQDGNSPPRLTHRGRIFAEQKEGLGEMSSEDNPTVEDIQFAILDFYYRFYDGESWPVTWPGLFNFIDCQKDALVRDSVKLLADEGYVAVRKYFASGEPPQFYQPNTDLNQFTRGTDFRIEPRAQARRYYAELRARRKSSAAGVRIESTEAIKNRSMDESTESLSQGKAQMQTARTFKYAVAISFAGEQRKEARAIAQQLKNSGVEVFFDEYESAALWGKDLYEHLSDVYQNQAQYCIILASQAYATKVWPSHERRNTQARALIAKEEYILPVRFDETDIPGLPRTVAYLDFAQQGVSGICEAFLRKIGRALSHSVSSEIASCKSSRLVALRITDEETIAFLPVVQAHWGQEEISLVLDSEDGEDRAILDGLRLRQDDVIAAYETNVAVCGVAAVSYITEPGKKLWSVKLQVKKFDFSVPMEMSFSNTSSEELAVKRARRLLLNDNPEQESEDLNKLTEELFISGLDTTAQIKRSPFPSIFEKYRNDPMRFLEIAWIVAVMQLKLSATVAEIRQLELSLQGEAVLTVKFWGRRHRKYQNVAPYDVKVEGHCLLD